MNIKETFREEILNRLNQTVIESAAFFASADETLSDGHQTAHAVAAQLVFWHEQYVAIAQALLAGNTPELKVGSFERWNQVARNRVAGRSMTMLAYDLSCLQKEFDLLLRRIPDWSINFPIKHDSEPASLSERLPEIEAHIRQHTQRLKAAQRV